MAAARVSGVVLARTDRDGKRDDGSRWAISTARVLVADHDVVDVSFDPVRVNIQRGEFVDLLVDLDVYRGAVQARAVAPYPSTAETAA